jgi:cytochrome c1
MQWIMDPQHYKPNTAMPKLGVTPQDAIDIAAYLYSLGARNRFNAMRETTGPLQ